MEEVKIEYLENVAECTELEFWHECRSPVSITEARDLYRGCYVEKRDYIKVCSRLSCLHTNDDLDEETIIAILQMPVVLPRNGAGHHLPFGCALKDGVKSPFGITVSIDGYNEITRANVMPCDISFGDKIYITARYDFHPNPEYLVFYSRYHAILNTVLRHYKVLEFETSSYIVYCALVPTVFIRSVLPFDADELLNHMSRSLHLAEEREYLAAQKQVRP